MSQLRSYKFIEKAKSGPDLDRIHKLMLKNLP